LSQVLHLSAEGTFTHYKQFKFKNMETPKWSSNMSDAEYLAYVLACSYLDIKPHPRHAPQEIAEQFD
jgi:hypothetical protein